MLLLDSFVSNLNIPRKLKPGVKGGIWSCFDHCVMQFYQSHVEGELFYIQIFSAWTVQITVAVYITHDDKIVWVMQVHIWKKQYKQKKQNCVLSLESKKFSGTITPLPVWLENGMQGRFPFLASLEHTLAISCLQFYVCIILACHSPLCHSEGNIFDYNSMQKYHHQTYHHQTSEQHSGEGKASMNVA